MAGSAELLGPVVPPDPVVAGGTTGTPLVTSGRHLSLVPDAVGARPAAPSGLFAWAPPGGNCGQPQEQQLLDLAFALPCGLPTSLCAPDDVTVPAPRRWPHGVEPGDRSPTPRAALPPPGAWAARLAQAVLEVCSAGRPVAQLLRWTSPEVFTDLQSRYVPRAKRDVSRRKVSVSESVRSVHVCEPADGVAEVSVFVSGGERPRALALRLEGWRGRWICTTLDWV
jgi:hypothetical protein